MARGVRAGLSSAVAFVRRQKHNYRVGVARNAANSFNIVADNLQPIAFQDNFSVEAILDNPQKNISLTEQHLRFSIVLYRNT